MLDEYNKKTSQFPPSYKCLLCLYYIYVTARQGVRLGGGLTPQMGLAVIARGEAE